VEGQVDVVREGEVGEGDEHQGESWQDDQAAATPWPTGMAAQSRRGRSGYGQAALRHTLRARCGEAHRWQGEKAGDGFPHCVSPFLFRVLIQISSLFLLLRLTFKMVPKRPCNHL
jgi:hypothetical protein